MQETFIAAFIYVVCARYSERQSAKVTNECQSDDFAHFNTKICCCSNVP